MQANPVGWPGISEMWAFPVREGATGAAGALVVMEGGGPEGNAVIVYFSCDDCAEEVAKASANGGKVVKEKFAAGDYGFIAIVTDTKGSAIGLHSWK